MPKQSNTLYLQKVVDVLMLNFLIGVVVGGIVGFFVCAVLSINSADKESRNPVPASKEIGDIDAKSK